MCIRDRGYLYARNAAVGFANDWFANDTGAPLFPSYYYYVGGNVGGPIYFPHFNKNKDKLFFWVGYEKMIQHPYVPTSDMNVPTSGVFGENSQVAGDFSNTSINPCLLYTSRCV